MPVPESCICQLWFNSSSPGRGKRNQATEEKGRAFPQSHPCHIPLVLLEPKVDQILISEAFRDLAVLNSPASHFTMPLLFPMLIATVYHHQCLDQAEPGPEPRHLVQEYMLLTTMLISDDAEAFTTWCVWSFLKLFLIKAHSYLEIKVLISPFYRWQHWGSERLNTCPKSHHSKARILYQVCLTQFRGICNKEQFSFSCTSPNQGKPTKTMSEKGKL